MEYELNFAKLYDLAILTKEYTTIHYAKAITKFLDKKFNKNLTRNNLAKFEKILVVWFYLLTHN